MHGRHGVVSLPLRSLVSCQRAALDLQPVLVQLADTLVFASCGGTVTLTGREHRALLNLTQ